MIECNRSSARLSPCGSISSYLFYDLLLFEPKDIETTLECLLSMELEDLPPDMDNSDALLSLLSLTKGDVGF